MSSDFFKVKKGLNISPSDSSTVTSPEVGDIIVDSSDNNKLKRYDDVTASWKDVGSGVGGINYISANSDFEGGTVGYATYADVAGEAPVDGTGGTATFVSIGTDSVSPLRGTKSGLISKTANNAQGQGVSYDFTIDAADQAQILRVNFDYNTSANYADGDIRVYIYDVTNSRIIEVIDRDLLASAQGKFVGTFQTSPDSLSYRLIFHVSGTGTTAWTVELDNVIVGPQTIVKGAIVTDWEACTITFTGLTQTSQNSYCRRVGDSLEIQSRVVVSAVAGPVQFTLPNNLSIDTNIFPQIKYTSNVRLRDAGTQSFNGTVVVDTSGVFNIQALRDITNAGTSFITNGALTSTTPFTWGATDSIEFEITGIPIQGWSSNVVLSEDAGNREIVCKANRITSSQLVTAAGLEVIFNNEVTDTSSSYDTTTGRFTAPESGWYDVSYALNVTMGTTPTAFEAIALINGSLTTYYAYSALTDIVSLKIYPIQGSEAVYLAKGDYISIFAYSVGANSTLNFSTTNRTFLSIAKRSSPQTIAASEVVAARYTQNYGQVIPSSTNEIINYSTKVYDTHNSVTTGTNWRFTAPQSGFYRITASLLYAAGFSWAATNRCNLDIYVRDGQTNVILDSSTINYIRLLAATTTNVGPSQGSSVELYLKKSDYIEAITQHNRGSDTSVQPTATYNYINIVKIAGTN